MYDQHASKPVVDCAGAAAFQDTAFRQAEKQYQLHLEQVVRYSKGRKRRVKHVPRPTDLSQVLDIRKLDQNTAGVHFVRLPALSQGLCSPGSSSSSSSSSNNSSSGNNSGSNCDGSSSADSSSDQFSTMLLFAAHPGLAVFPAALPAMWQLQLMQSALLVWPEPPARTNHTKAYGKELHGLFKAAQEDMSFRHLQQDEPQSACQQQQPGTHGGEGPGHAEVLSTQQLQEPEQDGSATGQQSPLRSQCGAADQQLAAAELISKLSNCCRQQPAAAASDTGQVDNSCCSSSSVNSRNGSSSNKGSDSTCRCEEQEPPGIRQVDGHLSSNARCTRTTSTAGYAETWSVSGTGPSAALLLRKLRWVCLGPPYNWTDRVYEPHLPHRPLPEALVKLAQQFAVRAAQPAACAYVPDAALVNYYHAGDTLNGHKDDVEPDLSQPIVTVSLGCPAVFLMGGLSKCVPPTAMLLRSGDVMVLSGEARRCYHGLPRVLDDQDLPGDVVAAAQRQQEVFGAVLQHMRQCRINISIRAVH